MGNRGPKPQPKKITADHVQILSYISQGFTNPQIATRMSCTKYWVNDQLKIIFMVLGVKTRAQAVAVAVAKRILSNRNMR